MDAGTLRRAYIHLRRARQEDYVATETEINANYALDSAWLKGLADGTITGKNPEMREASAAEVLVLQYSTLREAEESARDVRLALDLAQLDVNAMRDELRLLEITQ